MAVCLRSLLLSRVSFLFAINAMEARYEPSRTDDALDAVARLAGLGTWRWEPGPGRFTCSAHLRTLWGLATVPAGLAALWSHIHPEDQPEVLPRLEAALAGAAQAQVRYRLATAPARWMQETLAWEAGGEALQGVVQEVTAWYQEMDQRESERVSRLRLAVKGGRLGIWDWDVPSSQVFFDEGWAHMLGIEPETLSPTLQAWASRVHPDDMPAVEAALAAYFAGETPHYESEHRLQDASGHWRWIWDRGEAVARDASGTPLRITGVHVDITRLKETQAQLARSEANLEALLDAANELFVLTGPGTVILKANRIFRDRIAAGRGRAPQPGERLCDFFPAAERAEMEAIMAQAWAGQPVTGTRETHMFGESPAQIACYHVPVFDAEGQVFAVASGIVDQTASLLAQQQLADTTERLRLAIGAGKIGVWDADIVQKRNVWDQGMAAIYGIELASFDEEMTAWLQYVHPDDRDACYRTYVAISADPEQSYLQDRFRIVRPNGEVRHILSLAHIHRNEAGEITRMVGINWDETEKAVVSERLRRLNEELEQKIGARTQELQASNAELEHFAYSVSHDLRTPLRHLTSFSRLLHQRAGPSLDPEHRELLTYIHEAAERMSHQIEDLLAYSRIGRHDIRPMWVAVGPLLDTVWETLCFEYAHREDITLELGDLDPVYADPLLLSQSLQNLLSNALKYSARQERIWVRVSTESRPDGKVLMVQDAGIGFDMKHHDRIFKVFQRLHTGDTYEGNGIGLANVCRIAKRHGGRVWAESAPGQGATFYVWLPSPDTPAGLGQELTRQGYTTA